MSEPESKKQKTSEESSDDKGMSEEGNDDGETLDDLVAPFECQNLTLIVEGRKLFVRKEDLIEESDVFRVMFSKSFTEASLKEIPLPGKTLRPFVQFLRCLLPFCSDELSEENVYEILPLAEEYQANNLKERIDEFLADNVKKAGDSTTSDQIIKDIEEAEKFNLKEYLNECILVASRKKTTNLRKHGHFKNISQNVQLRISITRCKDIEKVYNDAETPKKLKDKLGKVTQRYKLQMNEVGDHLKPFMQNN